MVGLQSPVIGIHQPNFLPWPGYFLKIALCDQFIFMDHVAIDFRGYTRRTKALNTRQSTTCWISLPLKPNNHTENIDKYVVNIELLAENTINALSKIYSKTPYYSLIFPEIRHWIDSAPAPFHLFTADLIRQLCKKLKIDTTFHSSGRWLPTGHNFEMILDLVLKSAGKTYISGVSGKKYLDSSAFTAHHIRLCYIDNLTLIQNYLAENKLDPALAQCSILEYLFRFGWEYTAKMLQTLKGQFHSSL